MKSIDNKTFIEKDGNYLLELADAFGVHRNTSRCWKLHYAEQIAVEVNHSLGFIFIPGQSARLWKSKASSGSIESSP
jgi:hypothetical protein